MPSLPRHRKHAETVKAIRWASVVAYGRVNSIRAAGLVGIPHIVFTRWLTEWSETGEIIIDGWKVKKCKECGAPIIVGMKHVCLKRINRHRKPNKNALSVRGTRNCQWCGKEFKPRHNGALVYYCSRECSHKAARAQGNARMRDMCHEIRVAKGKE